jgi:hypothetical protein
MVDEDVQDGFSTVQYTPSPSAPDRECWYLGAVTRQFFDPENDGQEFALAGALNRIELTKEKGAAVDAVAPVADSIRRALRRCLDHGLGGEKILVHRAHVDVPAFALRRILRRQIAHRGEA